MICGGGYLCSIQVNEVAPVVFKTYSQRYDTPIGYGWRVSSHALDVFQSHILNGRHWFANEFLISFNKSAISGTSVFNASRKLLNEAASLSFSTYVFLDFIDLSDKNRNVILNACDPKISLIQMKRKQIEASLPAMKTNKTTL